MENLSPNPIDLVLTQEGPQLENNILDEQFLIRELEDRGWCYLPSMMSVGVCDDVHRAFRNKEERFKEAKVGNFSRKKKVKRIRKNSITWIENWQRNAATAFLNEFYKNLAVKLRREFFIPLKWHESQVALYKKGDYYKKHLDQLKLTKHRQVTTILFLNDCERGGELVIYNKLDRNKVDAIIAPKKGGLVIFFSSQIFHEVKEATDERMTLTTWLRDDDVPFLDPTH